MAKTPWKATSTEAKLRQSDPPNPASTEMAATASYPQQLPQEDEPPLLAASWMGGHLTEPWLQKTQQSPGSGRRTVLHPSHSWKNWHESVGISSSALWPHEGHVRTDRGWISSAMVGVGLCGRLHARGMRPRHQVLCPSSSRLSGSSATASRMVCLISSWSSSGIKSAGPPIFPVGSATSLPPSEASLNWPEQLRQ